MEKEKLHNFPFIWEDKEWWWARSIACVAFIFARDSQGQLYVLANKRGPGAPTNIGKWNCPCGYLDCNEGLPECAARETYEETGLKVDHNSLRLFRIDDKPHGATQNVSASFVTMLPGLTVEYEKEFTKEHMEANEVDEIKFVDVAKIDEYDWAFGHKETIKKLLDCSLYPTGIELTSRS